jgi:hypothetical protein
LPTATPVSPARTGALAPTAGRPATRGAEGDGDGGRYGDQDNQQRGADGYARMSSPNAIVKAN